MIFDKRFVHPSVVIIKCLNEQLYVCKCIFIVDVANDESKQPHVANKYTYKYININLYTYAHTYKYVVFGRTINTQGNVEREGNCSAKIQNGGRQTSKHALFSHFCKTLFFFNSLYNYCTILHYHFLKTTQNPLHTIKMLNFKILNGF